MEDLTKKPSSTQVVLEAVRELHEQEQVVTRETVAEMTGLKLSIVDDRLGALLDDGKVRRVLRGVYVPEELHPPARPISKTVLPDGTALYEIGDEVLRLTPREDRTLAFLTAGAATQAAAIECGRQTSMMVTEMATKVQRLEKIIAALKAAKDVPQPQMSLLQ